MKFYREIEQRLQDSSDPNGQKAVWEDPEVIKFIRGAQEMYKRNTLSDTRTEYMTRMLGEEWWDIEY